MFARIENNQSINENKWNWYYLIENEKGYRMHLRLSKYQLFSVSNDCLKKSNELFTHPVLWHQNFKKIVNFSNNYDKIFINWPVLAYKEGGQYRIPSLLTFIHIQYPFQIEFWVHDTHTPYTHPCKYSLNNKRWPLLTWSKEGMTEARGYSTLAQYFTFKNNYVRFN